MLRLALKLGFVTVLLGVLPAHAQLRGHSGSVRSVAVSPDGKIAVSGSFDTSAIIWSLSRNVAEQVLRFHESAVNAVVVGPNERIITGGEDGKIAMWAPGGDRPVRVLTGHTGPIVALVVSPDGKYVASASRDQTIRIWPLAGGNPHVFRGHQQNVNGVAFMPNGKIFVSASDDMSVRIWELFGGAPTVVNLPTPINAVAVARDEIIAGGADGRVFIIAKDGEVLSDIAATPFPMISVATSPDGSLVAAAGTHGSVAIIDRKGRKVLRTLSGPGFPVWSVAFLPDNVTLLTGGADTLIRRWNTKTGEHINSVASKDAKDPLAAYKGDRGAEVFRSCIACHALSRDDSFRAGPTLAGLFGRKIATLPGYNFSPALKKLDIVWTPETVSKLFELGPDEFTPGTKMPELKIGAPEDRAALVKFLERATKN